MRKTFFAFATLLLLQSCAPKLTSSSGLFWGNWILSELEGQPVQMSGTESDAYIHFAYNDMRVDGLAGCNRFNGTMTTDHKNLSFGQLAVTQMTCMNQAFEDKFLNTLKEVRKYSVDNEQLLLKTNKDKVLAKFVHRK